MPLARYTPEADAGLVPRTRQNGVLALGLVGAEELGRHMVRIGSTDRDDDMPHPEIELGHEALLNPELLEGHLVAAHYRGIHALVVGDVAIKRIDPIGIRIQIGVGAIAVHIQHVGRIAVRAAGFVIHADPLFGIHELRHHRRHRDVGFGANFHRRATDL